MSNHERYFQVIDYGKKTVLLTECIACGKRSVSDVLSPVPESAIGPVTYFEKRCENCELTLLDVNGEEVEK